MRIWKWAEGIAGLKDELRSKVMFRKSILLFLFGHIQERILLITNKAIGEETV